MMGYKKKATTDKVPHEIAFAFQHGKLAYKQHPGFEDATEEALKVYLFCGVLINNHEEAKRTWHQYRSELMKRQGTRTWWGFKEYEQHGRAN